LREEKRFGIDYLSGAVVQARQNERFLRFLFSVLKEFEYEPEKIVEFGIGDGELGRRVYKAYSPEVFYFIDNNERFLEFVKGFQGGILLQKNFEEIRPEDFKDEVDLVFSSNSFHWVPYNSSTCSWQNLMFCVCEILERGGFFIFHHGLKWTYFPLYDLAGELFYRKYEKRHDISKYLFYPTSKDLIAVLKEIGFNFVRKEEFYELENNENQVYTRKELYRSFSCAGLNAFLWEIDDEGERENFKKEFLLLCEYFEPPIFSHRGFFVFRKPYKEEDLIFEEITGRNLNVVSQSEVRDLLERSDKDFYPPLSERSPDDKDFLNKKGDDTYFKDLINNYEFILARRQGTGELLGFLTYKKSGSFVEPGKNVLYVSTILVKKEYRSASIGKYLLKKLIEKAKKLFLSFEIDGIETRTWSTNIASQTLLKHIGFQQKTVLKNHRAQGVDTEYYFFSEF